MHTTIYTETRRMLRSPETTLHTSENMPNHIPTRQFPAYVWERERERDLLTPFLRPLSVLSKAALVTSLKPEVKAPEAAKPAKNDCVI